MKRALLVGAMVIVAAAVAWVLFIGLPRWTAPQRTAQNAAPADDAAPAAEPARKIRARLYHVTEDGALLRSVDAEVTYGESTAEQARHLVEALNEPPPEPLLSALPKGTTVKSVFVSNDRVAYVDLSPEARNVNGGALEEILTVYSVVNTVADNLPAVVAVQVLVDGREVDTLSGHVDLRRPLAKDLRWAGVAPVPAPAPSGQ